MFLLYFLLMIVPLVLFHEFGHYIVARWMGVRVLSFSIGFGPTVVRWVRGHTEYAIRALPLGGFVRMLGDDPSAPPDSESQEPDSFNAKPVWRRALIVAAGPIANIILPIFILFFGALLFDAQVISSRVGTVLPEGPAARAGLRTGDRIVAIDGTPVATFDDLRRAIAARPGQKTPVVYERGGERHAVTLTPGAHRQVVLPELGLVDEVGRIEIRPDAQTSVVAVRPGSSAWQAGLRSGERIVAVDGKPTPRFYEMQAALQTGLAAGRAVVATVAPLKRNPPVPRAGLQDAFDHQHDSKTRTVRLTPFAPVGPLPAVGPLALVAAAKPTLDAFGIGEAQLVIGPVEKGSPADLQLGLVAGDEVLALDGAPARSLTHLYDLLSKPYDDVRSDPANRGLATDELVTRINQALAQTHRLRVRHAVHPAELPTLREIANGTRKPLTPLEKAVQAQPIVLEQGWVEHEAPLQLKVLIGKDERPNLQFGALAVQDYEEPDTIANPDLVRHAVFKTRDEMGKALQVTVLSVVGLFRGHVSVKEVGGPIFMAQLATEVAEQGVDRFLALMVWLSINLAILNLLPIPLVDGGHLLFLAVEAVKRSPVSLRTRQVSAYIGMSFLGLLFVVVMKNDVQRLIAKLAGE